MTFADMDLDLHVRNQSHANVAIGMTNEPGS